MRVGRQSALATARAALSSRLGARLAPSSALKPGATAGRWIMRRSWPAIRSTPPGSCRSSLPLPQVRLAPQKPPAGVAAGVVGRLALVQPEELHVVVQLDTGGVPVQPAVAPVAGIAL